MWLTLAAAVALAVVNLITPSKYHCDIDPAQCFPYKISYNQ